MNVVQKQPTSYKHNVERIKEIVLCCDGTFIGESVGLILNKQYDDINSLNVVFNDHNREIFMSVLRMDYTVREITEKHEIVIYPQSSHEHDWDCIHVNVFASFPSSIKNAIFDIDYVAMNRKTMFCVDGSYYMNFQMNGIQTLIERMYSKQFCMSYPHRHSNVILRAMSLISKGWVMDDMLLPGKAIVLRLQTEEKTAKSCSQCCSTIDYQDTISQMNDKEFCIQCVTKK